ncbi:flagellar type III secretion system pore protein FliP [Actinoplanes friuliensis]|jgi:flagellar biosynthesis protein FliP|uniref:Flagellar biosynthetic protein FliP n=1 Tax=Actinoplanes friuliensis DSM 7358 TaxID=1246995 RepID=U5WBI6_9ACTN|nr:flagellar type III secretion system pore protein FliP [Actinoplanes friuliensis]AGZ46357.1 flagellar biosynthetic protein FliP [Actinoplanes friuliensis DSM 7358]
MWRRTLLILLFALAALVPAAAAQAAPPQPMPQPAAVAVHYELPQAPGPTAPVAPTVSPSGGNINFNINGTNPDGSKPATSLVIVLGLTLLSVAPAVLLLCTCFTKVFMVLGITRNAMGLVSMPPNQVLAGLALFISLFIMSPVLSQVNEQGVQPYLAGDKTQSQAFKDGVQPLREFMLKSTREDELALLVKVSGQEKPANADDVELTTLIPAFVLSELRAAFIIGFVIFIPFLIIDMVVSASLMSLGMMMLPPVTVAMPFKLLLFVLINGWGLIITALVGSYA